MRSRYCFPERDLLGRSTNPNPLTHKLKAYILQRVLQMLYLFLDISGKLVIQLLTHIIN